MTTKASDNRRLFQVTETADIVVEVMLRYRAAGAYLLHGFVLMPDHLHLLLTPGTDTTLEKAMQLIKGGSSYEIHKRRGQSLKIWQAGFHEHTIRDPQDFQNKMKYIWANPVEAKLVDGPEDWLYSSASGKFLLDEMPASVASGAKAPTRALSMSELKLRPPKGTSAAALELRCDETSAKRRQTSDLKYRLLNVSEREPRRPKEPSTKEPCVQGKSSQGVSNLVNHQGNVKLR